MPGLLAEVAVKAGQEVKAGERLVVIEAMKMQNVILAERDAVVAGAARPRRREPRGRPTGAEFPMSAAGPSKARTACCLRGQRSGDSRKRGGRS